MLKVGDWIKTIDIVTGQSKRINYYEIIRLTNEYATVKAVKTVYHNNRGTVDIPITGIYNTTYTIEMCIQNKCNGAKILYGHASN